MKVTFENDMFDTSAAPAGYRLYKDGKYREAIMVLQELLAAEPKNWHARLILGAAFLKTGQNVLADYAFRFVYQCCSDLDVKQKASVAMQIARAAFQESAKDGAGELDLGIWSERALPPATTIEAIIA